MANTRYFQGVVQMNQNKECIDKGRLKLIEVLKTFFKLLKFLSLLFSLSHLSSSWDGVFF